MHREIDRLLYSWLFVAILSLVFAGVFAFLAAMTRTPAVKLLSNADYFRFSIVAHVVFSLVVWFLAFMAVLWAYTASRRGKISPSKWRYGFYLAVVGIAFMTFSCLLGLGESVLIDYVPLIEHPIYFAGLISLALGITVTITSYVGVIRAGRGEGLDIVAYGMLVVGAITIISFLSVFFSAISLAASNHGSIFWGEEFHPHVIAEILGSSYRALFWGPGHIIQFANTLAMMVVWFVLLGSSLQRRVNENAVKKLMLFSLLVALVLPLIYFLPPHKQAGFFTIGMSYGLGVPSFFLTMIVLRAIWDGACGGLKGFRKLPWREPAYSSLVLSIALFGVGGVIGVIGLGHNLRVPAHYHGSLGAVTMAFMGMTYFLLRLLGIKVYSERTARLQPYLYGLGLLVIIIGLFWAGSYNAPRKAFGYEDSLTASAMNIMGAGAVVAVMGGAIFVTNTMLSLLRARKLVLSK